MTGWDRFGPRLAAEPLSFRCPLLLLELFPALGRNQTIRDRSDSLSLFPGLFKSIELAFQGSAFFPLEQDHFHRGLHGSGVVPKLDPPWFLPGRCPEGRWCMAPGLATRRGRNVPYPRSAAMKYPKRSQYKYAKSRYRVRNWAAYLRGHRDRGCSSWFSRSLITRRCRGGFGSPARSSSAGSPRIDQSICPSTGRGSGFTSAIYGNRPTECSFHLDGTPSRIRGPRPRRGRGTATSARSENSGDGGSVFSSEPGTNAACRP